MAVATGLSIWGLLGLAGVSDDWRLGSAIVVGFAAMIACGRALGISASALWWWPLKDATPLSRDDQPRPPRRSGTARE